MKRGRGVGGRGRGLTRKKINNNNKDETETDEKETKKERVLDSVARYFRSSVGDRHVICRPPFVESTTGDCVASLLLLLFFCYVFFFSICTMKPEHKRKPNELFKDLCGFPGMRLDFNFFPRFTYEGFTGFY